MKHLSTLALVLLMSTSANAENVMGTPRAPSTIVKSQNTRVGLLGLTCMFSGGIYTIVGDSGSVSCISDENLFHNIGKNAKETGIKKVEITFHSAGSTGAVEGANILASYGIKSVIAGMDPIVCDMKNKVPAGTKIMPHILSPGWEPCNPASHLLLFTLPPHSTQTLSPENQNKILNYFKSN